MELKTLRLELDALSEEIIVLLAKRRSITKHVAKLKKEKKLPVYDGK